MNDYDENDELGEGDVFCPRHGQQTIVSEIQFTGYAGRRCYATELSCGCNDMDDSADVRAAY